MTPRVALVSLCCFALAACGGATFGGLGDDSTDTGLDASGGDDTSIFATDDGALGGSDDGTAPADDSGATDASGAKEAGGDAITVTDAAADAVATGDGATDAISSSDAGDASDAISSGDASDAVSSSDASDASEIGTVAAPPPLLSSNPAQVYCDVGGVKNVLCPKGQQCCGKQPFAGDFSWSCTGGSCNAPTAGSSRSYLCNEKADCGGYVCCVDRGTFGDMNGTHCHSDNSPCGDETACMTDADCPGSQKCYANTIQDGDFTIGMCK